MNLVNRYIVFLFCLIFLSKSYGERVLKVAFLVGNESSKQTFEIPAISGMTYFAESINFEKVNIDNLSDLSGYDIVWYHRTDSIPITNREKEIGNIIKKYVRDGGKLILSMEAVRLLNTWDIEPEQIESTTFYAQDEGFGRKVGFHSFREHPLFDNLFGGAYTWHGKEDNQCRVFGFFGDKKPKAEKAKVIGILWEYIYYHPKDKILWETPFGKGNILAIGGFLYYCNENFNKKILDQFTSNCLNYLAGRPMKSKALFWDYRPTEVISKKMSVKKITLSQPVAWSIPCVNDKIECKGSNFTIDLPSKRTMLIANQKSGIEEIWTHPFLSLRNYRLWLDIEGHDTLVPLSSYKSKVELCSNAIIRTYQNEGFQIKEVLTSQIDKPVVIAHYEWKGYNVRHIIIDYKNNLRFMWPYDENALGSIYYNWSKEANAFITCDGNKDFVSLVGSNIPGTLLLAGRYNNFKYIDKKPEGEITDKLQVASSVSYNVDNREAMDLFMVAGNEGLENTLNEYSLFMKSPQNVFRESQEYYTNYLRDKVFIITPDSLFNNGFLWATIGSAQFIVETPGVGTSLMAGFSSSLSGWGGGQKVSGRPGYAWYFGRDAVWSSLAFASLGDFKIVRQVLETLIRFQQVDGKIYHELTSSGSVHFDASDSTPLFVILMARYLRSTGDLEFIKRNFYSIVKAMDYCYSTDTDRDHLIEITNVGHGWLEGGELYGSHTEFYLSGLWNTALNDAAYIAAKIGNTEKMIKYESDAKIVNQIINSDFWNKEGFFNYGKRKDGSFTNECIALTTVPVYLGVTDYNKSYNMIKRFSSGAFSADWGVRLIDDTHSMTESGAYNSGNVWPLFTGWTALAEYQMGRYNQGFSHLMSNMLNYINISPGRIPEVINGSIYKSSGITLHQCWSETMVIQPIIEGMLGFTPNSLNKQITLSPRLPFNWKSFQVNNLRMADTFVSFSMIKGKNKQVYDLTSTGPVSVNFSPAFAIGTKVIHVLVNGNEVPFKLIENREYVVISLLLNLDKNTSVEIIYNEGMSSLPTYRLAKIEEKSKLIHVISQCIQNGVLEVIVEGRSGTTCYLDLYLPNGYERIEGTTSEVKNAYGVYTFNVDFESIKDSYVTKKIRVHTSK